ncbi:hypothetical protein [uncultured Dokdonia sp.]|uniref:hypothetical protein n=1 Tax=uncultured Dokdonia sp. TaxID=575653 RepID=UPI0026363E36|nr:hypothetical protein [uncultured Dokdonia sp.]
MKKFVFVFMCSLLGGITSHAQISNKNEAKEVYDFVFGAGSGTKLGTITSEDIANANLFVKELTEKSCQMGWIESIGKSSLKPNATVKGILLKFITSNVSDCSDEIKEGKVYESVKNVLSANWKGAFEVRVQTGSW